MSQATEPKLLIDLTNARHATALDASSILHRMQIEAFLDRVSEVVGRVEGFSEKLKHCGDGRTRSVSYERYHDVITLHGKRGSGKTTFLLSALELLQDTAKRRLAFPARFEKNNDDGLNGLCVLEILDPTLFGLHEHLLLSLMAKIAFEVRSAVKNSERNLCGGHNGRCKLEEWENHLRQFAKALKHMGETRDDLDAPLPKEAVEWEDSQFIFEQNMENAQRSFGLEREFHKFLHDSLKLIDKKAFVLALDDIDTRPQIGWHVLEVLRRYFTSPQLVVVLSGDMDLFKIIIEKQQLKIFDLSFDSKLRVRKEFKARVDGLTEQYLLKILRTPSRISLGSFQSALQQWTRSKPEFAKVIGKSGQNILLYKLLRCSFFPLLGCNRISEQRLFQKTLFANPARTVTQILDALWEVVVKSSGKMLVSEERINKSEEYLPPALCEPVVERMREVFLVSLQNMGIERPFELTEALQSAHGVNQLMKHLFERGYVATGLDLLPTRQNPDENNGLLALNVELTQAMRVTPALLLGYALKACLLREVLVRKNSEIDSRQYQKYEHYLGLEAEELPSVTAARISALHWGEPKNNGPIQSMGMVRLYGSSITKNAPAAVRAMYGTDMPSIVHKDANPIPQELLKFCRTVEMMGVSEDKMLRRWINTPETLCDSIYSWQCGIMGLGIIDIAVRDHVYRSFSIFPLLAAMCDFLGKDVASIHVLFSKYNNIVSMNAFSCGDGSLLPENSSDDEREYGETEEVNGGKVINMQLIKTIKLWADSCRELFLHTSMSAALCSNIMNRFFYAIARIDANCSSNSTFVGSYLHRCLIAFFNSVLVEEFLSVDERKEILSVLLDNPATSDNIFLRNIFSTKAIDEINIEEFHGKKNNVFSAEFNKYKVENGAISDAYPLFKAVFTFPLWGLYLRPDENDSAVVNSVYGMYIRSQMLDKEIVKSTSAVMYGEKASSPNFANMYHLLNSLAIPKAVRPETRGNVDSRTDDGKKLRLSVNPKSLNRKSIINYHMVKTGLLRMLEQNSGDQPPDFFSSYCWFVRLFYRDEAVIKKLCQANLADEFWSFVKSNLKP